MTQTKTWSFRVTRVSTGLVLFCHTSCQIAQRDQSHSHLIHCSRLRRTTISWTKKEGLGIVFGVKKFHQYVFGRHFTIYMDQKPLISLFGPTKATSEVLPPWIIRWSLSLSACDYDITYRPGSTISKADAMSRLPLPDTVFDPPCTWQRDISDGIFE